MPTTTQDDPGPAPTPPTSPHDNRFFDWMRRLDLPRRPGWIGGVCAGIAERLGIDPLIVRGIVVVVAILGGPAFLLYALAWLLLPDADGRIHLQSLLGGLVDRAIAGIAAVFLLGLLPVSQGFWSIGAGYWGAVSVGGAITRGLWSLLLIGGGIWLVVWLIRRAGNSGYQPPTTTPATTDDRPDTIPDAPETTVVRSVGVDGPSEPAVPAEPAVGAPADELAAWKERQAAWKLEHDAWKREQAATEREQRQQRTAEARARAAQSAAASAERRRLRRLANPRMSGGAVAISLGAALVVGGATGALASTTTAWRGAEATAGFAAATIVLGIVMIVAGVFRRRSGFIGFLSVLFVVIAVATAFLPRDRQIVGPSYTVASQSSGRFAQPAGVFSVDALEASASGKTRVIDVWQGGGEVDIVLPADLTTVLETTQRDGTLYQLDETAARSGDGERVATTAVHDGDRVFRHTYGPAGAPDLTIRIWQGSGSVHVRQELPETTSGEDSK